MLAFPVPGHDVGEVIDVVDARGDVVGACGKREAHARGLLHRTVVSEVFDSSGRWLLVRQADDRQDAGRWVSPVGGHVQAGELPSTALVRETFEELGMVSSGAREVGTYIYRRVMENGYVENHMFLAYEQEADDVPELNHESVEFRYFSEEELRGLLLERPTIFGEAFHAIVHHIYKSRLLT